MQCFYSRSTPSCASLARGYLTVSPPDFEIEIILSYINTQAAESMFSGKPGFVPDVTGFSKQQRDGKNEVNQNPGYFLIA
jgi:hypothetical protein